MPLRSPCAEDCVHPDHHHGVPPKLDAEETQKFVQERDRCQGPGILDFAIELYVKRNRCLEALEYLASEEAAFKGGTACSEYAKETLAKLAQPEEPTC